MNQLAMAQVYPDYPKCALALAYTVAEGGMTLSVKVLLSGTSKDTVSVLVKTQQGTATADEDYFAFGETFAPSKKVQFFPGATVQMVTVDIVQDTYTEGNETFSLVLHTPAGCVLGSPSDTVVTITEPPPPPTVTFLPDSLYLYVGDAPTLTANVSGGSVTFVSTEPTVATVSGSAPYLTVTGVGAGWTQIQAIYGGIPISSVYAYVAQKQAEADVEVTGIYFSLGAVQSPSAILLNKLIVKSGYQPNPFKKLKEDPNVTRDFIVAPEWNTTKTNDPAAFFLKDTPTRISFKVDLLCKKGGKFTIKATPMNLSRQSGKPGMECTFDAAVAESKLLDLKASDEAQQIDVTMNTDLDQWVEILRFKWQWWFKPDGGAFQKTTVSGSPHTLYIVDKQPVADGNRYNYVELLDLGCSWAAGKKTTTKDEVFTDIWTKGFATRTVLLPELFGRKRSKQNGMQYFGIITARPVDPKAAYDPDFDSSWGLLAAEDGQCVAWGRFFKDVCQVQGANVGLLQVNESSQTAKAFYIKEFDWGDIVPEADRPDPPANRAQYVSKSVLASAQPEVVKWKGVTWTKGMACQGQDTPGKYAKLNPPILLNNWAGKFFGVHNLAYRDLDASGAFNGAELNGAELLYDPSFGTGEYATLLKWQQAAVKAIMHSTYKLKFQETGNEIDYSCWMMPVLPATLEFKTAPKN